jgi:ketosteroid isomerase-like protein
MTILFHTRAPWRRATEQQRSATRAFIMSNRTTLTCWRIVSTFAIAFLAAGCASVRTVDLQSDDPEARAQIERRLHEVFVAAESKDFDRLESYHLYGPKFTRFSGASVASQDAAATRKIEHDGLASLQGLKMRAEALKIDVFGPVGIATFILEASFESGGTTVRRKDRSTLVFVKEGVDWKIAHEHSSPITLAEPDGAATRSQPTRPETNRTSAAAGSAR